MLLNTDIAYDLFDHLAKKYILAAFSNLFLSLNFTAVKKFTVLLHHAPEDRIIKSAVLKPPRLSNAKGQICFAATGFLQIEMKIENGHSKRHN